MARVVVRHGEDEARFLDQTRQLLGLGEVVGHRLVADDVKTGGEKSLGDREVADIGSDDADEINSRVGRKFCFRRRHRLVGRIAARRIEVEPRACQLCILIRLREAAGDEFGLLVKRRGDAMDAANKGTLPAADHSHPESSFPALHDYPSSGEAEHIAVCFGTAA